MPIWVSLIFGVIGLGLLVLAIVQMSKAKKASAWPTVPGTVLSSGLEEHRSHDSDGGTSVNYEPRVQYQYAIMGSPFTGYRLSFGNASYSYNIAARKIAAYPQGAQVTVYYNPDDPSDSVLEPKAAGGVVLIVIGVIFVVLAIVLGFTGA
jgi:hypothetical protein